MSVLSAQSIRRLCHPPVPTAMVDPVARLQPYRKKLVDIPPLITPFTERGVVRGKSYGLSACTYDCRIDQDLRLEPMPFEIIARMLYPSEAKAAEQMLAEVRTMLVSDANHRALASTMERFAFPHNVCGSVLDKSSYARVFVSAFNTHLDPGWDGFLTVELVNLGDTVVEYQRGDPVCQVKFEWLDEPTDLPYVGRKYSDQPARPVEALEES